MASDASKLRAAQTSVNQNFRILVDLISIDPQSWAVNFKDKSMISSGSFDKASYDGPDNKAKAIAMLRNIEQLIIVGNWNIFKSLVTLIYQNDVDMDRHLNSNSSITKKLIDVYKRLGGGKEIEAALKDVDFPLVPPEPQPLNNDNLASPNPLLPEGNPNGGLRGQGVERRPINLEPLPRGEENGSLPVAADPSPGHLRRRPVPRTHPVLDSEDKLGKERTKITKPDIPKKTSGWNWIKCAACWVLRIRAFFILVGIFIFAMLLEDYLLQLCKIKAVFSLLPELLKPNCNLVIAVIITTLLIILLKYICSSSAESHRSEPTRKKEKMLYGDRIPNFAEKWKELELCTKALCRISDESGRAVGFGIKLDDSTGFLVTTIHSFCKDVAEMKDCASLLFPLRDGARDQQQLSREMKKRIWQEFKYRFFVTEAKRGRDILCNQPGELNFFADVKNDVLVLRIADGRFPDGVKPMELNFDPKSTNISSWTYASVDIFAHPKCEHKDSEICNQACLLHSQGIISPTKRTKTLSYWISTDQGFSGSPVLAWTSTQSDGIEKLRLCPIAVHGGEYDHKNVQMNYCTYFLPIAEDIKKLLKEWKPEEERADSTFRDTLKLSGLVALKVNFED